MSDDDYQRTTAKLHRRSPPSLPEDLIFEILLRCPVKFLLQLKCICKSWKTLISYPQFTYSHIRRLTGNPSIIHQRVFSSRIFGNHHCCIESYPMKRWIDFPSNRTKPVEFNMEHKFNILGSCNGLLCLFDINHGYVKLWNPSIGFESRNSPTLDCYDKDNTLIRYYGFGYDHVNDKYKILLFLRHGCDRGSSRPRYDYVTQIYTFGENCWRTIRNFRRAPTEFGGKFVSGTLNWLVVKKGVLVKKRVGYTSNDSVILSFDLEKETYRELLLPKDDGVKKSQYHMLGVFSNSLCVRFASNKTHYDFWLMKIYGVVESWTRLTIIHPQMQFAIFIMTNRHIYHESLVAPQC